MAQKPYRFSKKVGQYIPNTQSGNREYYHELLRSINPEASFDPNSTYGKYIMKKTVSDLRKYRHTWKEYELNQSTIKFQLRWLSELQKENQLEKEDRRNRAVDERASEIVRQKYRFISLVKKRAFMFAVTLFSISYFFEKRFQLSFWIFISSWLVLSILAHMKFNQLKGVNLSQAANELKSVDFGEDFKVKESLKKEEINEAKKKVEILKKELKLLKIKIRLKVQKLLNEDKLIYILSDQFYNSTDWKKIRDQVISRHDNICVRCGSIESLAVDHIYPRSKFPEKALDISNTQILCQKCNSSKGNRINK